jgi:hypothetical protein
MSGRKIVINYADKRYYQAQKENSRTALQIGEFTHAIERGSKNIDMEFYIRNRIILEHPHGAGYWLWKPYIILKELENMNDNDILFYCDAGASFVGSFNDYLFDLCRADEKGLILFNGGHINKKYTKRDCFYYMDCDTKKYTDATQLTATFQLCRKTKFTIDFYNEHLKYSQDPRILTDMKNVCGKENYDVFVAHRHDQSILTNLKEKYDVTIVEDISQWGDNVREPGYKTLINHHRNGA